MKRLIGFLCCGAFLLASFSAAADENPLKEVRTAPEALALGKSHVQGICCSEDAVFLSFENALFKIDWNGNLMKSAEVQPHAGDLTLVDGHIFVSMSEPEGFGVFEFDEDLKLIEKYKLEATSATDGIAFLNGHFFIGGPSVGNIPHLDNRVSEFDRGFNLVKEMTVNCGEPTLYGTQAIKSWKGSLIMAFYVPEGSDFLSVRTEPCMRVVEKYRLFTANGITSAPPSKQNDSGSRFLVAETEYTADKKPIAVLSWFELRDGAFVNVTD